MSEAYSAHVLDNGLTVLLQENHSAPIVSHQVWYRVGSRNEVPGKTGISHFVEHMQFRGTKRFPGEVASREIFRNGGILEANTYWDWTAFCETMPADRIGIAIEMEADRMVNSLFDPKDVELERTVILSEQEGDAGDPLSNLMNFIRKTIFPHHPYGWDILGETEDLLSLTRDDLYDHYRTWYAPNNAVISVTGHFRTEEMLRRIETACGAIPPRTLPALSIAPEEPVDRQLTVEMKGFGDFSDLQIAWHVPDAKDPDIPALTLLTSILAGTCSMNTYNKCFISNRTSRLFRKLVNGGMTADVSIEYLPTLDPYYLIVSAPVSPGVSPEEVREAVFEEFENIAGQGVLPAEIAKARRQANAMFACSAEDIPAQAHWLGYSSMFAGPSWYPEYLQRLESVSAEDISRVAGTYFRRDNCVTGIFRAKEE